MPNEITGFFISFTSEESADIMRRLELFGYKPDGEGLKKLVIDSLCDSEMEEDTFESPTDRLINSASQYIKTNPEHIVMGINAIKGLAGMLNKRKK
jgi:hypothetical protein